MITYEEGTMTLEQDVKRETSIPLSARVSIVTLAEIDMAWRGQERMPKTMSQLVSWSLELLHEILDVQGQLPMKMGVAEAHSYLQTRGLYQGITKTRGFKKIVTAMGFEALREQGINPKQEAPRQYNTIHHSRAVEPKPDVTRLADIDEAIKKNRMKDIREETEEEREARIRKTDAILAQARINARIIDGIREGMSEEELNKYDSERENERQRLENQPPDLSNIELADE